MKRNLTDFEYQAILRLAKKLEGRDKDEFLEDLKNCTVEEATVNGSRLIFHINGYDRPPYIGQHEFPSDSSGGCIKDSDGEELSVFLYADQNNRILELEFIKWSGNPIRSLNWATFEMKGQ